MKSNPIVCPRDHVNELVDGPQILLMRKSMEAPFELFKIFKGW